MNYSWLYNVIPIAAIFSFRMLGLFMLIPVFTLYAPQLSHSTPLLIGIALGSYGLSQGLLQLPFGLLSDRFGRKKIIVIGLVLFALGSLIGAFSTSIYGIIIARIFQGMGAIGSVLIALVADLTPDSQRTRAMAVIGVAIGMSFSLAMVLSPLLTSYLGFSSLFYFSAFLGICGLLIVYKVIPDASQLSTNSIVRITNLGLIKNVLIRPELLRLNSGIFFQHAILTATFFILPILLQQQITLSHLSHSWQFYLPLMVIAFILMLPLIYLSERKNSTKLVFLSSIMISALAQLLLFFFSSQWTVLCLLFLVYFICFNFLEASLPAQISKQADPVSKGTAMGVYSSCQFLGIFFGGSIAGFISQYAQTNYIFIFNALLAILWFFIALAMQTHEQS